MESAGSHPLLPSLRLDELLDELQVRLQAVLSTRDRVYSLLEAVVAVGSSLELEVLLRSIVETAVSLVDARYGAMGVIGEGGRLAEFIPVGISSSEIEAIHHWPEGKGLLGLLVTDPKPLRLAEIKEHPASFGFPAGHPPMKTFLGVPIRIRGEVYGNLYLTEKHGGGQFDTEDEAVVIALAAAAGVAIENARLYDQSRRQQRWLSATAEVTRHLLSGAEPGAALSMITDKALEMTGADLVMVTLPMPDGRHVRIEHAAGLGPATRGSSRPPRPGCRSARSRPCPSARLARSAGCSRPAGAPAQCRCPRRRQTCWPPSPRRRRSRSSWPSTACRPSRWRSSRTATGSPRTCTTW